MVETPRSDVKCAGNGGPDASATVIDYSIIVGLMRIRRRRRIAILAIFLFPVLAIFAGSGTGWRGDDYRVGFILVLVAFLLTYNVCVMSACPRCGLRFFFSPIIWNPFRKTCGTCGIPVLFKWNPNEQQWREAKRWINGGDAQGIIPDMGSRCPTCDYNLTGLGQRRCPECGTEFNILQLVSINSAAK